MITKNDIVGLHEVFGSDLTLLMADESEKPLGEVVIGDKVRCMNGVGQINTVWEDVEIEPMIHLTVANRELILRGYHPVYTERGIIVACELRKGIKVLTKEGTYEAITGIREEGFYDRVYDVDLSMEKGKDLKEHIMYMNGIAVGDYIMENHLEYL